jgi:hypothetical protein
LSTAVIAQNLPATLSQQKELTGLPAYLKSTPTNPEKMFGFLVSCETKQPI